MIFYTCHYVTSSNHSSNENKLMERTVNLHQFERMKGERGTTGCTPSRLPAIIPPSSCHHAIRGAIRRTGCDLYVCFWRGVLINSHERGPSIQPASKDALHWAGLLFCAVHKKLKHRKKRGGGGGGWVSWCVLAQMMPLDWCPLWVKKASVALEVI